MDKTTKELVELKNQMADISDRIAELTNAAGEEASDMIDHLRGSMGKAGARVKEVAQDTTKKVDDFVHDEPWKTAAIAAGVGALVAYFIGRNRD